MESDERGGKPREAQRSHMSASRFRRQGDKRTLVLVILTLVVVGGGLIALIRGPAALVTGLPCLMGGAVLILLPWLLLTALEKWRDRMERADRAVIEELEDKDPVDRERR